MARSIIERLINDLNAVPKRSCFEYPLISIIFFIMTFVGILVTGILRKPYLMAITFAGLFLMVLSLVWHTTVVNKYLIKIDKILDHYKIELAPYYRVNNKLRYKKSRKSHNHDSCIILKAPKNPVGMMVPDMMLINMQNQPQNSYANLYQSPYYVMNYIQNQQALSNSQINPQQYIPIVDVQIKYSNIDKNRAEDFNNVMIIPQDAESQYMMPYPVSSKRKITSMKSINKDKNKSVVFRSGYDSAQISKFVDNYAINNIDVVEMNVQEPVYMPIAVDNPKNYYIEMDNKYQMRDNYRSQYVDYMHDETFADIKDRKYRSHKA